jgi:protein SDA1
VKRKIVMRVVDGSMFPVMRNTE